MDFAASGRAYAKLFVLLLIALSVSIGLVFHKFSLLTISQEVRRCGAPIDLKNETVCSTHEILLRNSAISQLLLPDMCIALLLVVITGWVSFTHGERWRDQSTIELPVRAATLKYSVSFKEGTTVKLILGTQERTPTNSRQFSEWQFDPNSDELKVSVTREGFDDVHSSIMLSAKQLARIPATAIDASTQMETFTLFASSSLAGQVPEFKIEGQRPRVNPTGPRPHQAKDDVSPGEKLVTKKRLHRRYRLLAGFATFEGICEGIAIPLLLLLVMPSLHPLVATGFFQYVWLVPQWLAALDTMRASFKAHSGSRSCAATFRAVFATIATIVFICYLSFTHPPLWWPLVIAPLLLSVRFWRNYCSFSREFTVRESEIRYSLACIASIWKAVFFFSTSFLVAGVYYDVTPKALWEGITNISHSPSKWYLLASSCTGVAVYFALWVASASVSATNRIATLLGFMFPFMVATPVTMITIAATHHIPHWLANLTYETLSGSQMIWVFASAGFMMLVQLVCNEYIFYPPEGHIIERERDVWFVPGFQNPAEQYLLLNRKQLVVRTMRDDAGRDYGISYTHVIATMWHEGGKEMRHLLNSFKGIASDLRPAEAKQQKFTFHVVFDDAWTADGDQNDYVKKLFRLLLEMEFVEERWSTQWYGAKVQYKIKAKAEMNLFVYLKDTKKKVKNKKRWSQILAVSEILRSLNEHEFKYLSTSVFVMLLDGDTRFNLADVKKLREAIMEDKEGVTIGGASGRIYPEPENGIGNLLTMYQRFEYAAGHWLQKVAEHVFGTVLCSPGCFSLVRLAALIKKAGVPQNFVDESAIESYCKSANSALDILMLDQGEDRMLSTLMIMNGWRLKYVSNAYALTVCPHDWATFFNQRRRWITSTLANMIYLFAHQGQIRHNNASVSLLFIIYCLWFFVSSLLTPVVMALAIVAGLNFALHFSVVASWVVGLLPPGLYIAWCWLFFYNPVHDQPQQKALKLRLQQDAAFYLTGVYACLMMAVFVGLVVAIATNPTAAGSLYSILISGIFVIAALLHGLGDTAMLVLGLFVYFPLLPAMNILLLIYAVANVQDQAWGTRDADTSASRGGSNSIFSWRSCVGGMLNCLRACGIDTGLAISPEAETKEAPAASQQTPITMSKAVEGLKGSSLQGLLSYKPYLPDDSIQSRLRALGMVQQYPAATTRTLFDALASQLLLNNGAFTGTAATVRVECANFVDQNKIYFRRYFQYEDDALSRWVTLTKSDDSQGDALALFAAAFHYQHDIILVTDWRKASKDGSHLLRVDASESPTLRRRSAVGPMNGTKRPSLHIAWHDRNLFSSLQPAKVSQVRAADVPVIVDNHADGLSTPVADCFYLPALHDIDDPVPARILDGRRWREVSGTKLNTLPISWGLERVTAIWRDDVTRCLLVQLDNGRLRFFGANHSSVRPTRTHAVQLPHHPDINSSLHSVLTVIRTLPELRACIWNAHPNANEHIVRLIVKLCSTPASELRHLDLASLANQTVLSREASPPQSVFRTIGEAFPSLLTALEGGPKCIAWIGGNRDSMFKPHFESVPADDKAVLKIFMPRLHVEDKELPPYRKGDALTTPFDSDDSGFKLADSDRILGFFGTQGHLAVLDKHCQQPAECVVRSVLLLRLPWDDNACVVPRPGLSNDENLLYYRGNFFTADELFVAMPIASHCRFGPSSIPWVRYNQRSVGFCGGNLLSLAFKDGELTTIQHSVGHNARVTATVPCSTAIGLFVCDTSSGCLLYKPDYENETDTRIHRLPPAFPSSAIYFWINSEAGELHWLTPSRPESIRGEHCSCSGAYLASAIADGKELWRANATSFQLFTPEGADKSFVYKLFPRCGLFKESSVPRIESGYQLCNISPQADIAQVLATSSYQIMAIWRKTTNTLEASELDQYLSNATVLRQLRSLSSYLGAYIVCKRILRPSPESLSPSSRQPPPPSPPPSPQQSPLPSALLYLRRGIERGTLSTCYQNAAMQAIACPPLYNWLSKQKSHPDPKVAAFIEHFAALMKELIWPSCTGPLDLGALRAAMAKLPYKQTQRKRECNPFTEQFGGTTEEDVCEYISTLFDALEKSVPQQQNELKDMISLRCRAITTYSCSCPEKVEEVALDAVLKLPGGGPYDLTRLLRSHWSEESEKDCENCNLRHRIVKKPQSVSHAPALLIIRISRVSKTGKISDQVRFPVVLEEFLPGLTARYRLHAVVVHNGVVPISGHYVAYVRHHEQWVKCNDQDTTLVLEDIVLDAEASLLIYRDDSAPRAQ